MMPTQRHIALHLIAYCALVSAFLLGRADAQVRLPNVQVPQLPPIQLPVDVGRTAGSAADALDPSRLRDLRRLRVRALLRTHRDALEADPSGAPIVKGQITAYAPTERSLQIALQNGFTVVRRSALPALGIDIAVLAPPPRMSTRVALRRLRQIDSSGSYDFNHVYVESGELAAADSPRAVVRPAASSRISSAVATIGLVDTGINLSHPAFANMRVEQFGCDAPVPAAHGTAVASLLIGQASPFAGAAPGGHLYSADVYCGRPTGGSIENIAAAFAWLSDQKIAVINVSLVGPKNIVLEKIVATLVSRGHIIVAAVGNDGPSAKPLYPAAYPGVIGVTGVDAKRKVLVEALRGPQVYFAAPGADMGAAGMNSEYVAVRGTSFAAPIVAGLLAQKMVAPAQHAVQTALAEIELHAIDLGARGVDKQFGHGLVGETIRVKPHELAAAR